MAIGLVGRKYGMTRVFEDTGVSEPVSVVHVEGNRITQIKTLENDGYCAIQVTTGERKQSRVNKPMAGHYAKAEVAAGRGLWEFRLTEKELAALADQKTQGDDEGDGGDSSSSFEVGGQYNIDSVFSVGQKVDVTGTSKGKGFAGVIKRHNFKMQDATHGNSLSHRAPGSIGQNQTPGRVFKGKKMAGRMGGVRTTIQNLEIIRVDAERNLLLIRGAIPGAPGGSVIIMPSCKSAQEGV